MLKTFGECLTKEDIKKVGEVLKRYSVLQWNFMQP
jgi:hypothetical protein